VRNVWLVIKHEIISTLGKLSFWVMTFLFPLLIVGISVGSQVLGQRVVEEEISNGMPSDEAIGYVDLAGLIQEFPEDVPADLLLAFPTEDAARDALAAGEIGGYYLIPADFLDSGDIVLISGEYAPFKSLIGSEVIERIVSSNLTGDATLARLISSPTGGVESVPLAPEGGTDADSPMAFIVPYATLFIFFFVITMSSGFMLQSVAKEKENRVIEVLLLSVQPREMMLGKVVGLGTVALLQMVLWAGTGLAMLGRGAMVSATVAAFSLPSGFLIWALLYFLLGYLLYASLMAALGALAPSMREGQQFTFVIMLPLMAPLLMVNVFAQTPNAPLAIILSLFPLTAPVAMMARLAATGMPFWQPLVGLVLLAATAYLVVAATARLFRAQTLLSGATLTPRRIWSALQGQ
jgi:ABC-2 type transport system permease protein